MAVLFIGDEQRHQIDELRAFAASTPFDAVALNATSAADMDAFRDMMRQYSMVIPTGNLVFYSHELQPCDGHLVRCHHISISVDRPNMMPSPFVVKEILECFEMLPLEDSAAWWIDDVSPGVKAINVVQVVRP